MLTLDLLDPKWADDWTIQDAKFINSKTLICEGCDKYPGVIFYIKELHSKGHCWFCEECLPRFVW
jgi:hypothetical protein